METVQEWNHSCSQHTSIGITYWRCTDLVFPAHHIGDILTRVALENGYNVVDIRDSHLCWQVTVVGAYAVNNRSCCFKVIPLQDVLCFTHRLSETSSSAIQNRVFVSDCDLSCKNNISCINTHTAVNVNAVELLAGWVVLCIIKRHWEQIQSVITRLSVDEALVVR